MVRLLFTMIFIPPFGVASRGCETAAFRYAEPGTYKEGHQLSSPLYIGMRGKHGITRIGYNLPGFGDFFQNGFHHLIGSPNFQLGNYSSPYYQSGRYMPYSLY
jgi:hypothetical protein